MNKEQLKEILKLTYEGDIMWEQAYELITKNYQPKTTSTDIEGLRKEFEDKFEKMSNGLGRGLIGYLDGVNDIQCFFTDDIWNYFLPHLSNKSELKREAVREIEYQAMLRFGRFLQANCGIEPIEDDNGDPVEFKTLAGCLINLENGEGNLSSNEKEVSK